MADYLEVPCLMKWGQKDKWWLEDKAEEHNESIQRTKEEILAHMAAYPRDFKDELGNDWTWEDHVQQRLNQLWDDLGDDFIGRYLAQQALNSEEDELKQV